MLPTRTLIIDGYNVIRRTPALANAEEHGGLAHGRDMLLARLVEKYRHRPEMLWVVFDGAEDSEQHHAIKRGCRGTVVFTRYGERADDVIQRLSEECQARGETVEVISDDLEVRTEAQARGAIVAPVTHLAQTLNPPSRDVHKRGIHRMYKRDQWRRESEK